MSPLLPGGLTAVPGIEVGHATMLDRATGCTVVLTLDGATAGVDVRGGAPGTRETDLLRPVNLVEQVHAVVLAGGSAFGLNAVTGVMDHVESRGAGFPTPHGRVPIIPAAVLYDLGVGGPPTVRPDADCGSRAARNASTAPVPEGNVGAGAGATVGKLAGADKAMKGGLASVATRIAGDVTVGALCAVNAAGDIVDPDSGAILAGARDSNGGFIDLRASLRAGRMPTQRHTPLGEATTLGVIATGAKLDKAAATKIAQMAQDGFARTIVPAHTPWDGDTIFCLGTGRQHNNVDIGLLGAVAAELMAIAVVRAIGAATSLPGIPAASDLADGQP
ncbi:MAG: P1 family peptidase [Acidobacteriota bacterium]